MADTLEDAEAEARADVAENRFTSWAHRSAEGLGEAVFGTPVEKDGVTIVPVARVR